MSAGRFVRRVRLDTQAGVITGRYPFSVPVVAYLARYGELDLAPGVTFLVGDNGTGKSTLVEAIAVAAGFNPEGGSQHFRFATRASESSLGDRHASVTQDTDSHLRFLRPSTRSFVCYGDSKAPPTYKYGQSW